MKPRGVAVAALAAGLLLAASSSAAQEQRTNDPRSCPYCRGDEALMQAAGLVSHGGFAFGRKDTAAIDGILATSDVRWIESAHFEIGFALGPHKVKPEERNKIRDELTELSKALPEVKPATKLLDPWLRAHLYAMRCEKVWNRMLEILQVKPSDFPAAGQTWLIGQPMWGKGPYLGQAGKYEVLIVPTEAAHRTYLNSQFGLMTRNTQRWNEIASDTLSVTMHVQQGQLRDDAGLHGHVAFNLGINLLDGYKHYSYDTPIWIREGLGHFLEREIDPKYNSFDSSEGGVAEMTRKSKWEGEVKKLVLAGPPRMAELVGLKEYADLKLEHHFTVWSMVAYLIREHPKGFARLNARLHGNVNEAGLPSGEGMLDLHREAFGEALGLGYAQFDAAWASWVLAGHGGALGKGGLANGDGDVTPDDPTDDPPPER